MIVVFLPGDPRGKGRPRSTIIKPKFGNPFISVYTDEETRAYEKALKWSAKAAMKGNAPLDGPLRIVVTVSIKVPKSWSKKDRDRALSGVIRPTGKPDVDNYLKAIDSLNEVVWTDDSQVVDARVMKLYSESPSLHVEVYEIEAGMFAEPEADIPAIPDVAAR